MFPRRFNGGLQILFSNFNFYIYEYDLSRVDVDRLSNVHDSGSQ